MRRRVLAGAMLAVLVAGTMVWAAAGPRDTAPLAAMGGADEDPIAFTVTNLDSVHGAKEPVISYAPNGTLWYAGMNRSEANLWWAEHDGASMRFWTEDGPGGPPTWEGIDATVHHDLDGRVFWAEQSPVRVLVREGDAWVSNETLGADRPWFATRGDGRTFLLANEQSGPRLWEYDNTTRTWVDDPPDPLPGDGPLADLAVHPNGTLHALLMTTNSTRVTVQAWEPGAFGWTRVGNFTFNGHRSFGIARAVVDAGGDLYVVYGAATEGGHGVWLRRHLGDGAWTAPFRLTLTGSTGAMAGVAAGAPGRLGVAFYEADEDVVPGNVTNTTAWRLRYVLVRDAHASPEVAERVEVATSVHLGPMQPGSGPNGEEGFGDFVSVVQRRGDAAGRVAIAFVDGPHVSGSEALGALPSAATLGLGQPTACLPRPCPTPPPPPTYPWPWLAVQVDGRGLA